jgi:DNA-binding winged helix-turn-helix (wHTH) protein
MMVEAARLMVVGSALFVRVTVGEETLLDQRDSGLIGEPEAVLGEAAQSTASFIGRTAEGVRYLDVTTPIFVSGLDRSIGHVRIGFDLAFVGRQTGARALGTAGVAAACDAALIGTIVGLLALRRKRQRTVGGGDRGLEFGSVLVRGDLRVDPVSKSVTVRGEPVDLTPKQFNLLVLLAEVPGRVLSDDDILCSLWPGSAYANSSDVKQCVYTLRRRLERVVESPAAVIVNVKGYGYKLVPPGTEADLSSS